MQVILHLKILYKNLEKMLQLINMNLMFQRYLKFSNL